MPVMASTSARMAGIFIMRISEIVRRGNKMWKRRYCHCGNVVTAVVVCVVNDNKRYWVPAGMIYILRYAGVVPENSGLTPRIPLRSLNMTEP